MEPKFNASDFVGIVADRGVDLDTGYYWARVGERYYSGHSAIMRDTWFNVAMIEAVKERNEAKAKSLHAALFEDITSKEAK